MIKATPIANHLKFSLLKVSSTLEFTFEATATLEAADKEAFYFS